MSYVDRFLTYAPLTDTLDVCGGDTAPSYVRVENKHFAPNTKGRFRVYVPEDQLEQLKEKNEKLTMLVCHLMSVKPRDVTGIRHKGEFLYFDKLLEEVGLRWKDAQ